MTMDAWLPEDILAGRLQEALGLMRDIRTYELGANTIMSLAVHARYAPAEQWLRRHRNSALGAWYGSWEVGEDLSRRVNQLWHDREAEQAKVVRFQEEIERLELLVRALRTERRHIAKGKLI